MDGRVTGVQDGDARGSSRVLGQGGREQGLPRGAGRLPEVTVGLVGSGSCLPTNAHPRGNNANVVQGHQAALRVLVTATSE